MHFSLGSTFLFDEMPTFREALTLPAPATRSACAILPCAIGCVPSSPTRPGGRSSSPGTVLRVERVVHPHNERWLDQSVAEIADATDADPLDAFLDISLDEHLETQFVVARPPNAERQAATERMIRSPVTMAGSSDGGAHLLSFCGADFTTRLLAEWVPSVLTLEAGRGAAHVGARARHRDRRSRARSSPAWRPTCW